MIRSVVGVGVVFCVVGSNGSACIEATDYFCIKCWMVLIVAGVASGSPVSVICCWLCLNMILGMEKLAVRGRKDLNHCKP